MNTTLLKSILDDEFLGTLAKSADLYKIGSNSVLDPEEIRIGLKVVPRAVMSMLISELSPMTINSSKDIQLPFGKYAYIRTNKNAADDYTGSVYNDNKLVYSFQNRSIPGLGIIILSTFELYDVEELAVPPKHDDLVAQKVQKLIDERMELHSLVSKVVEDKMSQREAMHKLVMDKLGESLKAEESQHLAPSSPHLPVSSQQVTPIDLKPKDIVKKEESAKKGSPLKDFMARKKNKPKKYFVEMAKSETVECDSCGQKIFGEGSFSGCICFGENMGSKIWIKKSEEGFEFKFSRNWTADNVELLLETLRKGK